ncbi:hypothetical protein ACHAQA_006623 [Verticillium albo-atrum]
MLYDSLIPPLTDARHKCRILAHEYNTMPPSLGTAEEMAAKRFDILKRWLGSVGEGVFIEPPFTPDYGCNMIIGKNSYMNFGFTILDTSLVIIGERVMLGPNVHIYSAGHDTSVLSRVKCIEFGHPVRIEDDCWIGGNVTILAGVTIGRGCTVGAGSVVSRSLPPYSVAIGSPAKVIKTLPTLEEELADPTNPYHRFPDRS